MSPAQAVRVRPSAQNGLTAAQSRIVAAAQNLFARHGVKVVFFGRFVAILRTYAAFLAGTNRMPWRRFLVVTTAAAFVWSAVYTFASYTAGHSFRHVSGTLSLILGGVAVVVIVVVFLIIRRKSSQLEARAEAAYPGPLPG